MSTYYDFHTEAMINGEWHCIDPLIMDLNSNEYRLQPTYWNGSRSYFSNSYDWLRNRSIGLKDFDELSNELKNYFCSDWKSNDGDMKTYYTANGMFIPLSLIESEIPKDDDYDYHALVLKDAIRDHKSGMADIDMEEDIIDPQEYAKLPEEAQKMWSYYEWDDEFSTFAPLRALLKRAKMRVEDFCDENYAVRVDNVRLFLVVC